MCYKYNKLILCTLSNFNKLLNKLDIETTTPVFFRMAGFLILLIACWTYRYWGLEIIADYRIIFIICKGPKYSCVIFCLVFFYFL